jgi:hypothetical protein
MAATIYSAPKEIKQPTFNFENFNYAQHQEQEDKYIADLKAYLAEKGYTGKNAGETISFPVADSSAVYMVVSMRPLQLMEVPVGDCWTFQYVHLLTAKEVQEKIDQKKAWAEMFSQKGKK